MSSCESRVLSIILLILINLLAFVRAQDSPRQCISNGEYINNSTYDVNLNALLNALSSNIDANGYYTASVLQNEETANALAQCRADQTFNQCRTCVKSAASELYNSCHNQRQGIVWYDNCMVRYSDEPLDQTTVTDLSFIIHNGYNASNPTQFKEDRDKLLEDLRLQAADGSNELKAAAGKRVTTDSESQTIYALAQCTQDLSAEACNDCLNEAATSIQICCDLERGLRMFTSDCNIQYEFSKFYNEARLKELRLLLPPPPLGACYGTLGNNLPQPKRVIALCNNYNIRRIRLYTPNPSVLQALQDQSDISVMVGVADEDIPRIAKDASLAKTWVQNNVVKYGNVNFRYIVVGNEIGPSRSAGSSSIAPSIAPAMRNIYNALSAAGLGAKVKVSTALSMGVLGQSNPPSAGAFNSEIQSSFINPIVQFLVNTKGPFLVNVYPYYAYISNINNIALDYALSTSPSTVMRDGKYEYQNLFSAMVDAVHAALESAGGENLEVVVSETGWPSDGGTAANVSNARSYNSNLLKIVQNGTPRRHGKPIETYIFDLIDENQKSSDLDKHWGLFLPNRASKYPLPFGN